MSFTCKTAILQNEQQPRHCTWLMLFANPLLSAGGTDLVMCEKTKTLVQNRYFIIPVVILSIQDKVGNRSTL